MPADRPETTVFRVADLSARTPRRFELRPDAAACGALASALGFSGLRKLSFTGEIRAEGKADWRLDARLGATVVQSCVVSLAPVTTRIDTDVTRRFLAQMPDDESDADEIEMPDDETIEPLGEVIDIASVMAEALVLAAPDYPRASSATLEKTSFSAPGVAPMTDDEAKPFAGLAGLRGKLENRD